MSSITSWGSEQRRERQLGQQLCERASGYYPELVERNVRVELLATRRRQFARIYRYRILAGDAARHVFVKVPSDSSWREQEKNTQVEPSRERPRLVPLLSPETEARLEYAGLRNMMDHFARRRDPRLQAPKVLDLLDGGGIVVEAYDLPTLSRLLSGAHRFQRRTATAPLAQRFRSAGAWLKAFHEMPIAESARPRLTRRSEIVSLFGEFVTFLRVTIGESVKWDGWRERFGRYTEAFLPSDLPLVTGHGDFGPHNLFVAPNQGIIGFDTLACWQVPALEDLAYFLLLLETVPPLFVSRTLVLRPETVAECRQEFLDGYNQDATVSPPSLRLFEILVTMEKWVSAARSWQRARGARALAKKSRLALQQRCFRRRLDCLFNQLSQEAGGQPPDMETRNDPGNCG